LVASLLPHCQEDRESQNLTGAPGNPAQSGEKIIHPCQHYHFEPMKIAKYLMRYRGVESDRPTYGESSSGST
jgi:hypothetical protein